MPKELRLSIDKTALEQEWVEQPALYFEWAKEAADCQSVLDREKSRLDVVKAELEQSIRDNPGQYNVAKVTEASVAAAILTQPEYQAAVRKVNDARHAHGVANAAVNALEHRKRSLSMLVELWVREYYTADSSPRARSPKGEEFDKAAVRGRGRKRLQDQEREGDDSDG
jgi:hypothetical protein